MKRRLIIITIAWMLLWWWPLRYSLESDMALHMTVQIPLLIGIGLLLAPVVRGREPPWLVEADWLGIPGMVAVVLVTSFWMIPRALDSALSDPLTDATKFVTLPLAAGLPLGLSWRRMPPLGRAFIWANFIPKLGAIGGLYLAAPVRLCAYYRIDQQTEAGLALVTVAAALGVSWFFIVFFGLQSAYLKTWLGFQVRTRMECESQAAPLLYGDNR